MKMKVWAKYAFVLLVVTSIVTTITGCTSKSPTSSTTQLTYTVRIGTVALAITAVGSVNYSDEQLLSFDTGGTLSEVDVKVGDTVTKGQVLAKLDMTEFQANITTLQEALAAKNVALANAQQQKNQAEQGVDTAKQNLTAAQNNLMADQISLAQDKTNLENYQAQSQLTIASDELAVKQAQYAFDTNTGGTWASANLALKKQQLSVDQALIQATLESDKNKIIIDNNKITADQAAIQNTQTGITNAQTSVTITVMNVANAQQAVNDAQTALDQANATSPEITAPFDGLVITVNTTAGQVVYKGQTIVTIVDPNKFEADISVGETDIPNVKIGGGALIQFDALPNVTLPGKVASIAPTATMSQGVVTYAVTVDVESLQNLTGQSSPNQGGQRTVPGIQAGNPNPPSSSGAATTSTPSEPVQLKEGMTATVTITYQTASNVLVIPNEAITRTGNVATVDVLKNGVITKQPIQTGLSNSTLTEVTSGLNEGETIVYYRTTSTSTSSNGFRPGGGGFFGGGGP